MKRWQKKLTKKELKHIKETTNRGTLSEFKSNREAQIAQKLSLNMEPCWECRIIASKLGIE
jgi:hypothetical protein